MLHFKEFKQPSIRHYLRESQHSENSLTSCASFLVKRLMNILCNQHLKITVSVSENLNISVACKYMALVKNTTTNYAISTIDPAS